MTVSGSDEIGGMERRFVSSTLVFVAAVRILTAGVSSIISKALFAKIVSLGGMVKDGANAGSGWVMGGIDGGLGGRTLGFTSER